MVFCICIKFFYCLDGLKGNFFEVLLVLKWFWLGLEGKVLLWVINLIFYYVFFSSGDLEVSGKCYLIDVKMIVLFSDEVMKVNGFNGKVNFVKVYFYVINDFGGVIEGNVRL